MRFSNRELTLKAFSPTSLDVISHLHLHLALLCGASISTTSEMTEPPSEPCPKDCVCSGNPDAIRVDCSNLNITRVPPDIGLMTSIL
ncbi:hypothetical protein CDAR_52871 [Caerostris darwini]|uniref:LRRNT domain-containing protein n=1 Tax=Caerostris darwini TaxID=1538125 RepID=A0AAV4QSY7_9ARAC|nr:hypothetical protein CDAR_52871 [Caerostris darwini]